MSAERLICAILPCSQPAGLQLTPDSAARKRTADELVADQLVAAVVEPAILMNQGTPTSGNVSQKNPLHWKDDGKDSNCVQLAEATIRHNPYQSKWGDIAANWNRVLKDLQDRNVIPLDKDYRCLQHKMKSMLDTVRAHNEACKNCVVPSHMPRRPFSDKLFGMLTTVLEVRWRSYTFSIVPCMITRCN